MIAGLPAGLREIVQKPKETPLPQSRFLPPLIPSKPTPSLRQGPIIHSQTHLVDFPLDTLHVSNDVFE